MPNTIIKHGKVTITESAIILSDFEVSYNSNVQQNSRDIIKWALGKLMAKDAPMHIVVENWKHAESGR